MIAWQKNLVRKPVYWLFVLVGLLGWSLMFFGTDDPQIRFRLIGSGISFVVLVSLPITAVFLSKKHASDTVTGPVIVEEQFSVEGFEVKVKTLVDPENSGGKEVTIEMYGQNRVLKVRMDPENPTGREISIESLARG